MLFSLLRVNNIKSLYVAQTPSYVIAAIMNGQTNSNQGPSMTAKLIINFIQRATTPLISQGLG